MRTARGNRIALAITGLVLLAGGLAALTRGAALAPRVFGTAHAPVTGRPVRHFADGHVWFWIALAAAALVLALLALRWLAAQSRTPVLRAVRLEPDPRHGATNLSARAVTGALEDDLAAGPYLRRASAVLTGGPSAPYLLLSAVMAPDADPVATRRRIHEAVDRTRRAMEIEHLPAVVRLRTGR
jgi:hypothetical protein